MKTNRSAAFFFNNHEAKQGRHIIIEPQTRKSIASKIIDADALQAERFSIKPRACEAIIEVA